MQNKWLFLLGSKTLSLEGEGIKTALSLLREHKISAKLTPDGELEIPFFLAKRAKKILDGRVVFTELRSNGAAAAAMRALSHFGALGALLLLCVFYFFISFFVFDVKVEGNISVSTDVLLDEIGAVGLYPGARFDKLSFSHIENQILDESDDIAWVSIYRRGLIAYVTVREKAPVEKEEEPSGYANIVSTHDGVVEDVIVEQGSASVAPGQTVRKGELLISAFDLDGKPQYAKGEVFARVFGSFSVFIPRKEERVVRTEYVLCEKSINIFGFSINIFKNYRNLPKEYDIIEDKRRILLSEQKPLPISVSSKYAVVEVVEEITYTDLELIERARNANQSALVAYLASSELLSVRTTGYFTEEGYMIESSISMLAQIGTEKLLSVSDTE